MKSAGSSIKRLTALAMAVFLLVGVEGFSAAMLAEEASGDARENVFDQAQPEDSADSAAEIVSEAADPLVEEATVLMLGEDCAEWSDEDEELRDPVIVQGEQAADAEDGLTVEEAEPPTELADGEGAPEEAEAEPQDALADGEGAPEEAEAEPRDALADGEGAQEEAEAEPRDEQADGEAAPEEAEAEPQDALADGEGTPEEEKSDDPRITAPVVETQYCYYFSEGYVMLIVYEAPEEGSHWVFDGMPLYTTGDGEYFLLIPDSLSAENALTEEGLEKLCVASGSAPRLAFNGDVNIDGEVNIADANIVSQLINGGASYYDLEQLPLYQRILADADRDLRYTISDQNMIVDCINGVRY